MTFSERSCLIPYFPDAAEVGKCPRACSWLKGYTVQRRALPARLPVQDFITHCWREPFHEFMDSLRHAYDVAIVKPHLFICAFSLFQGWGWEPLGASAVSRICFRSSQPLWRCAGAAEDIQEALGQSISQAPFVSEPHDALKQLSAVDALRLPFFSSGEGSFGQRALRGG